MCDTQFGYKDGLHEPQKLLLLGFMYCSFYNEIDHMENLWHLINPNFKQKVSMNTVKSVLEDLLYISIDQRLKMLDHNQEETTTQVRIYLEQCESNKVNFINKICDECTDGDLGTTSITKAKF